MLGDTENTLKLIQEYRQRFVGSTAEQIVLDACEKTIKSLQDNRTELLTCFYNLARDRDEIWEDLERVTKERDEARREVCDLDANGSLQAGTPTTVAADRGWDCFKDTFFVGDNDHGD